MRKIRVGYTVEMDDATFDRLATRALRMGYPFEGKKTEKKRRDLVRRLLKECGRSEMLVLRDDEEMPYFYPRPCQKCGASLEEYGIGEPPNEECTACGYVQLRETD
jgi:hypothetical protein